MARYCPNCSAELTPPEVQCWNCGALFGPNSTWTPTDKPTESKQGLSWFAYSMMLALLLLPLLLSLSLLWMGRKTEIWPIAFYSPVWMLFVALVAVIVVEIRKLGKPTLTRLVVQTVLFGLAGGFISWMLVTIIQRATENPAEAAGIGFVWIYVYGPLSVALGQLTALLLWWFKKERPAADDSAPHHDGRVSKAN